MRKIYILISQTGTLFSRGIKWYTKQPYNHSAITTDKYFPVFWSFARRWPRLPFPGCFVKEEFNKGTYALFPDTDCIVLAFEAEEEKAEKVDAILESISILKVRLQLFDINFQPFARQSGRVKRHRRTCMEFVAYFVESGS